MLTISMLLILSILCHAQEAGEYRLFVGEFENRAGIVNPLLDFLSDTLSFLFSRSELAEIHPISPGLRSACLQRARNEQPNVDAIHINLSAAEYARADALLVGFYTKTDAQWAMEAELYVMREGSRARENIQPAGKDVYSLLDNLAAEVSKRLGTGQYMLLSTQSWEACESYRQGHQAYYNFDLMGAMTHFQRAIELDPHLAIAQAELGLSYAMMSMLDDARAAFAQAMKNLRYASEQEQTAVMGLESFYRYYWVLGKGGGLAGADIPRMRGDTVWDEPWLNWYITETTEDAAVRNRAYKQWLVSATAYAGAGFYGIGELVNAGADRCLDAFDASGDPEFLNAAIQFIAEAADLETDDEYDDAWKHWELANIYDKMDRPGDVRKHKGQWLQAVKRKPIDGLSPSTLNDFAGKCLEMGASEDALEFATKAVQLESDVELHALYLVTLADAHLASGDLTEAFNEYIEAFGVFTDQDVSTSVLAGSLTGLASLMHTHPESVDEARRTKLNEIMNTIEDIDPLKFRGYSAAVTLYSAGHIGRLGYTIGAIRDFCRAMGNMGPLLEVIRSLFTEEAAPAEKLAYLAALVSFSGGMRKPERAQLSSPEFIQTIAALNNPMQLSWVYEMIGELGKAADTYQLALGSESPETRMMANCALMSLHRNLGKTMPSQLHVYLEAEESANFTPYFEIAEAPEASGGKYLWAPDTFDGSHDGKGVAVYEFEITQPGVYRLVARMLGDFSYANGIRASIGNNRTNLDVTAHGAYRDWSAESWKSAAWEWRAAEKSFILLGGKHRLVVHNEDDGVKLDCMVLYREK